jgi:hypothetical protein
MPAPDGAAQMSFPRNFVSHLERTRLILIKHGFPRANPEKP